MGHAVNTHIDTVSLVPQGYGVAVIVKVTQGLICSKGIHIHSLIIIIGWLVRDMAFANVAGYFVVCHGRSLLWVVLWFVYY